MGIYASQTKIHYKQTLKEIGRILYIYGVRNPKIKHNETHTKVTLEFVIHNRKVRFYLPLPSPTADEIVYTPNTERERAPYLQKKFYKRAKNQRWRALGLAIKSRLVRVEDNITSFDEEFLGNIVLANGRTLADMVAPNMDELSVNKTLADKFENPQTTQGLLTEAAAN